MKKSTTIRRIIGITALVLWGVAFSSVLLPGGDRVAWQIDCWALHLAVIITPVYAVLLTIHLRKGKHWMIRLVLWICCGIVVYVCGIVIFLSTLFGVDRRAWSNKDYVVYSEFDGFIEPNQLVLYRRDGLVDRKMYCLRGEEMGHEEKVEYTMYDSLDLIKENASYTVFFTDDSICHRTIFYRLSDGHRYGQDKNDSLFALIENKP